MAVLVTGGAGYIGSHTVAELLDKGEEVVVVDNLGQGHKEALLGGKLYVGDLRDGDFMDTVFKENTIDSVIHFAANSLVGESMQNPAKYYHNNVYGTLCLLDKMNEYGVKKIVFSSTAATYGEPENVPILETDRTLPTNAYGETKLAMEKNDEVVRHRPRHQLCITAVFQRGGCAWKRQNRGRPFSRNASDPDYSSGGAGSACAHLDFLAMTMPPRTEPVSAITSM